MLIISARRWEGWRQVTDGSDEEAAVALVTWVTRMFGQLCDLDSGLVFLPAWM